MNGSVGMDFFYEQIPQSIGKYKIESILGEGGMGRVYKAFDPDFRRFVALKIITVNSESSAKRFTVEMRTLAKLNHPHIIRIFDYGHMDHNYYFTMEYIEGKSLHDVIQEQELPVRDKVVIFHKITSAISYMHRRQIIHRDLKLANIMMKDGDTPVVMDFGLAKDLQQIQDITKTGDALGTLSYMSPEQLAAKKNINHRSDIYSLGVIFYEMLTKTHPHRGDTALELMYNVWKKKTLSPSAVDTNIPQKLSQICLVCLEKKAHRRYAKTAFLTEDLKLYLQQKLQKPRKPISYAIYALPLVIFAILFSGYFYTIQTTTYKIHRTTNTNAIRNKTV